MEKLNLLSTDEISRNTVSQLGPLGIDGLILMPTSDRNAPDIIESVLERPLPAAFQRCLRQYSYDDLAWQVQFGHGEPYATTVLEWNQQRPSPRWWEPFRRPSGQLMIAQGDPFVLLLDLESGHVRAFLGGEDPGKAVRVALDFELLIRGLGTLLLDQARTESVRDAIAERVGGDSLFWRVV